VPLLRGNDGIAPVEVLCAASTVEEPVGVTVTVLWIKIVLVETETEQSASPELVPLPAPLPELPKLPPLLTAAPVGLAKAVVEASTPVKEPPLLPEPLSPEPLPIFELPVGTALPPVTDSTGYTVIVLVVVVVMVVVVVPSSDGVAVTAPWEPVGPFEPEIVIVLVKVIVDVTLIVVVKTVVCSPMPVVIITVLSNTDVDTPVEVVVAGTEVVTLMSRPPVGRASVVLWVIDQSDHVVL